MSTRHLQEKWEPILSHQDLPEIKDPYRKAVTAQLLENQERFMREQSAMGASQGLLNESDFVQSSVIGGPPTQNTNPAGQTYGNGVVPPVGSDGCDFVPGFSGYADNAGPVAGFDPVMISLIRRSMPNLIAYDVCGVQPMTGPTGLIFAMRSMYDGPMGPNEAFFDEPDPSFSANLGLPTPAGEYTYKNPDGSPIMIPDPSNPGNMIEMSREIPYDYVPGRHPMSRGGAPDSYGNVPEVNSNPGLLDTVSSHLGYIPDTTSGDQIDGSPANPGSGRSAKDPQFDAYGNQVCGGGDNGSYAYGGGGAKAGFYDPVLRDLRGMQTHMMEHAGEYHEAGQNGVNGENGDYRFRQMGFSIEKVVVEARGRALKAQYSMELAQDLRAIHGLDAEAELANILSSEILAEINREVIRTVYRTALPGAQNNVNTPGIFDLDLDSNGRWSVEKFKGLLFQIERDCNAIAQLTRRGKGNMIICSADVASALTMAGVLDYTPALNANLNVDDTGNLFAGTINGKLKVYIDPFSANVSDTHYYLVGYKGTNAYDAGLFYCPYIPLQMVRSVSSETFQPNIGFKTRYGIVANPFAEGSIGGTNGGNQGLGRLSDNTNRYYRRVRIDNLM